MGESIELVIFDLDGTLVDAYPAIVESFNFAMRKMGLPLRHPSVIRRAVGWGDQNLLKPFVAPELLTKALLFYRKHHTASLKRGTRFLPGARAALAFLQRKGYKLAVASNRPTKFSHIILKHLKIKNNFDYILCGDKVDKAKPHPEILHRILKKLSVKPAEALYVGDMTVDVEAGNRAGVKTVAVLTGSSTKRELGRLKPYKIIGKIGELKTILNQINGKIVKERKFQ